MIKHWLKLLFQQKSIFFSYFITMGMLTLLCFLYQVNFIIVVDLFRYTFLPNLLIIIFRAIKDNEEIKKTKNYNFSKMPKLNSYNLVYKSYQKCINKLIKDNKVSKLKEIKDKKNNMDYLMLWSHEMKTPITELSLLAENNEFINSNDILLRLSKINHDIESLLTYEKVDKFNHDLNYEWVPIKNLIISIVKEYSILSINKDTSTKLIIDNNLLILTDRKWISYVIKQIIYNAIKYSDFNEEILITFNKNTLSIKNNGLEISSSDLPRIFEPGFIGSNGRKNNYSTGMGLYLSKNICERLDIKIEISSAKNETITKLSFFPSQLKYS